ncbi:hypothetical protein GCM10023079_07320 [Streptomyces chitinivorans]
MVVGVRGGRSEQRDGGDDGRGGGGRKSTAKLHGYLICFEAKGKVKGAFAQSARRAGSRVRAERELPRMCSRARDRRRIRTGAA